MIWFMTDGQDIFLEDSGCQASSAAAGMQSAAVGIALRIKVNSGSMLITVASLLGVSSSEQIPGCSTLIKSSYIRLTGFRSVSFIFMVFGYYFGMTRCRGFSG